MGVGVGPRARLKLIKRLPVAAGIFAASSSSAALAAVVALAAPVVGVLVLWGGTSLATARLRGAEEQLVQKVTPAR